MIRLRIQVDKMSGLKNQLVSQLVKVRKLKSFKTHVPKVSKPKPTTNIIKAAILYLVYSDPLLRKIVSEAKEVF